MNNLNPLDGEFCTIDSEDEIMMRTMKLPNFKTEFIFCTNYNQDDISKDNRIFFWLFMLNTRDVKLKLK